MNKKILVVGQTPPPVHGQAIMIENLLVGNFGDIQIKHVRLAFSENLENVGKFQITKTVELIKVIWKIYLFRFKHQVQILYYPPAGPNIIPILRDVLVLIATRWLFKRVIFHIHASGLTDIYPNLSSPMKFLFRKAYYYPDVVIRLSEYTPEDGKKLMAKHECVVPNGIRDEYPNWREVASSKGREKTHILFVSLLRESKGLNILLEACAMLRPKGYSLHIDLVGKFISKEYEREIRNYLLKKQLNEVVTIHGELSGSDKWNAYASADIFCFPTYYDSEGLSLVLIEALCFGLPIVTTTWRGIPSIVEDGQSGFTVPIKDAHAVAEKIELLILNPSLRDKIKINSRRRYLECFSLDQFHNRVKKVFEAVISTA